MIRNRVLGANSVLLPSEAKEEPWLCSRRQKGEVRVLEWDDKGGEEQRIGDDGKVIHEERGEREK